MASIQKIFRVYIFPFVLIVVSCSKDSNPNHNDLNKIEDFSFREGKHLFIHYCSPCHGENGDGFGQYLGYQLEPQPVDFTDPDFLNNRNDELLFKNISDGSIALGKSNLCPPWGNTLRNEEINYLIDYIKSLKKNSTVMLDTKEY